MAFNDDFLSLKTRLRAAGIPVDTVLAVAGVNRSSWTRWSKNIHSPRVEAWDKVKAVAEDMLSERGAAA